MAALIRYSVSDIRISFALGIPSKLYSIAEVENAPGISLPEVTRFVKLGRRSYDV